MAAYTWTTFPVSGSANFETTARAVLELWRSNTDDMEAKLGSIADGTIDAANVTIPSGKTLDVSAGTFTLATDQISGDKVEGGTINAVTVNTLTIGTVANGSVTVGSGKTLNVSAGTLTLAADQISGDKVEGGTINAVTINTLTSTTVNATTVDTNVAAAGVTLSGITLAADGTDANIDINITPKGTGEVNITKVDIDAGTIDGATISTSNVTVGSGKTIDVSAGTLTLANDQISGDKIHGGTISAFASTGIDDNADAVAITIDSSERVGIGTASPLEKLDVNGNVKITGELRATSAISGAIITGSYQVGTGYASSFLADSTSGSNSRKSGVAFMATFGGSVADYTARRSADIISGYNGGIWGTEYLTFNVGGASDAGAITLERMRINGSGNVGIGTTSPVNKLDVEGAVAIGATYSGTFTAPTNGLIVEGNVGIGAASPGAKLEVYNSTVIADVVGDEKIVSVFRVHDTSYYDPILKIAAYRNSIIDTGWSGVGLRLQMQVQATNMGYIEFNPATPVGGATQGVAIGANNTEIMRLISGNVGIGVATPVNKLDVEGAVAIGASYSGTSTAPTNGLIVAGNVGIGTASPGGKLVSVSGSASVPAVLAGHEGTLPSLSSGTMAAFFGSLGNTSYVTRFAILGGSVSGAGVINFGDELNESSGSILYHHFDDSFRFATATTEKLAILSSGNVGIGVATPVNKLDVEGAVAIGAAYSGTSTAPTNGLIVEGNVGIGVATVTAALHLKACTAAANTASLKINAGTVATTPVSGNIESDGTHLWWTDSSGTRKQLDN